MVGLACGDALGAQIELIPENYRYLLQEISDLNEPLPLDSLIDKADNELELNRIQRYIDYMVMPGLYTDDTQQAILIAYSLIRNQGVNIKDIANLFVKGARLIGFTDYGVYRHPGPGFRYSVNNLILGKPLNQSGAVSAGNGAAMRIAPLGIFLRHDISSLLRSTIDLSLITHRDIRGIAAAGIISYTVAYSMNKSLDSFNYNHFLNELIMFISELEDVVIKDYHNIIWCPVSKHQVSKSLNVIENIIDKDYNIAIQTLDDWVKQISGNKQCFYNSPFVLGSVIFSLYLFMTKGMEFEKAIITAVNSGGDADTIGAMVGCMCGALNGCSSIPLRWTNKLINIDYLKSLGQSLITLEPLEEDPIDIEKKLCLAENNFRNNYRNKLHKKLGF